MSRNRGIELNNWRRQNNEEDSRNDTLKLLGLKKWKTAVIIFGVFSVLSLILNIVMFIKVFTPEKNDAPKYSHQISTNNTPVTTFIDTTNNNHKNRIQALFERAEKDAHSNITTDVEYLQIRDRKINATVHNLTSKISSLESEVLLATNDTQRLVQKIQQDVGWIPIFNGFEYLVRRNGATFNQSQEYCAGKGGNLATVGLRSNITRKYIAENIISEKTRFSTWIGLNDLNEEGVWRWIDGQRATTKDTNFFPGEPNDFGGGQDCAYLHKYPLGYRMADFACDSLLSSLCERRTVYD